MNGGLTFKVFRPNPTPEKKAQMMYKQDRLMGFSRSRPMGKRPISKE
jgi:hypothetical protein